MCTHVFLCKECITEKTLAQVEKGGIAAACKFCGNATNLGFIQLMTSLGNSAVQKKAQEWKATNTK